MAILLDTNTLLWMDAGDHRLGKFAVQTIDAALLAGEAFICPISYWRLYATIPEFETDRLR